MKKPVSLASVLDLREGTGMSPGLRGPPARVEDFKDFGRVHNELRVKGSICFEVIDWHCELRVSQVMAEDSSASDELGIDRTIGAPGVAKRRLVFRSVFWRIVWSLEGGADDISERNLSRSPALVEVSQHVCETCCRGRLRERVIVGGAGSLASSRASSNAFWFWKGLMSQSY